jgi:parvulin-like peptidyl-prolyl isomerase
MRFRWILLGLFLFLVLFRSPAPAIVADRILAVVNHEVIALSDVQKHREVFMEMRDADDAAALNDLINQKLLLAEAKKLEILPPSDGEIAGAYKKLRFRFGRPETFQLLKTRLALTDDEIKPQIKQQLLIQKLIEQRIRFFVFVTPEEIEGYYQEHLGEFKNQTPEAARKAIQEIRSSEKAQRKLVEYVDRLRARADIRINRPLRD